MTRWAGQWCNWGCTFKKNQRNGSFERKTKKKKNFGVKNIKVFKCMSFAFLLLMSQLLPVETLQEKAKLNLSFLKTKTGRNLLYLLFVSSLFLLHLLYLFFKLLFILCLFSLLSSANLNDAQQMMKLDPDPTNTCTWRLLLNPTPLFQAGGRRRRGEEQD